jgi:hypothetical protein
LPLRRLVGRQRCSGNESCIATVTIVPAKKSSEAERWLLVTVSTAGSSTLRVHAWRKLRSLGALYLQNSVALVPARPQTARALAKLLDRLDRSGGEGRALPIAITDPKEERRLIEQFSAERSDEYGEIVSRVPAFLEEIALERRRGRASYGEVEESEADLERLRKWLDNVRARDYFGAPGCSQAEESVERCARELAAFEAEAFAAELPGEPSPAPTRRLRAVDSGRPAS